jgi:hypothetical protein
MHLFLAERAVAPPTLGWRTGETQTQVGVGVREDYLRELLDSRCTKKCVLQLSVAVSKLLTGARVEFVVPLNLVFVTASCFGSEN